MKDESKRLLATGLETQLVLTRDSYPIKHLHNASYCSRLCAYVTIWKLEVVRAGAAVAALLSLSTSAN